MDCGKFSKLFNKRTSFTMMAAQMGRFIAGSYLVHNKISNLFNELT